MPRLKIDRAGLLSWVTVGALLALCALLAYLQYGWIGEVSVAERERMRASLQASLERVSRAFNEELTTMCIALLPPPGPEQRVEQEYAGRYLQWKQTGRQAGLLARVAVARPEKGALALRILDPARGEFVAAAWPPEWQPARLRLEARMTGQPMWRPRGPGGGEGILIELPRFGTPPARPGMPPFGLRETTWLLIEPDLAYVRDTLLPDLLEQHLGAQGAAEYEFEVMTNAQPPSTVFRSGPALTRPDAAVNLFEIEFERLMRRGGPPGMRGGEGNRGRPPGGGWGRWRLAVQHREGSLDAVVERARRRNLAVTGAILLLMVAAAGALLRFTRQTHRLAQLQIDFVAGVSHELRTPLTVIRTAAYNLRGPLAGNPERVERYGALIQQESERLTSLVEQVLQFARARSGTAVREREPVALAPVITETVEAARAILGGADCEIEVKVDPALPHVLGDRVALKQVLLNLVSNAIKYGAGGSNWIGISAAAAASNGRPWVELCVADRGLGIPENEQQHIFDPFYRGRRALQDQVHGTGLGLSLVKSIVEAHGGTITVVSEPGRGAEFTVRIPAAPPELRDEFAHSAG
jgi:signal transduction histidine kinase